VNRAIKHAIWFLIFEFLLLFFALVLMGELSADGQPLPVMLAIAASIGTTARDIGIGFFIIGTFANLAIMFVNIARGGMQ
jgi:hypothetical protein